MDIKKYNYIKSAEDFLLGSFRNGLTHSYDVKKCCWVKPYPEATGYLLSYFSKYFSVLPDKILDATGCLSKLQHQSGGYPSFCNKRYLFTFDTAQIMNGFASLYKRTNNKIFLDIARKCADFVLNMQINNGAMFPAYDIKLKCKYVDKIGQWGINFSAIQVKNIEGFLLMYELTNDSRYLDSAIKLKNYGKEHCDLTFTHPGAYCLEGLMAINENDFVRKKLEKEIIPRVKSNGFLSYASNTSYAYVSGSVQMGILLYKVGLRKIAYSILCWARKVQQNHDSGGLFQYANFDSSLNQDIHTEINSWGTKYYVELERLFKKI